jgi:phosphoribosylanthranilate isomerase
MKLKFCGLNNLDSLRQACDLNADFVGFIFAEQSPRKVELNFIAQLIDFNFCQTVPVCVFVNPLIQEVKKAINILPNAILQFHGDESDEFCRQFHQPFWKSIPVKDKQSLSMSDNFPSAQAILLETFSENLSGGTGKSFDWTLLDNMDLSKKFILAGGINPDNMQSAISLNPWCIDINSGVESELAIKDNKLMAEIMTAFNHG